jgi:two-component system chemotaxis response regulator CheB
VPAGEISPITCPECKEPLWVKESGSLSHFRCHTGHAYTGEVLSACQNEEVEAALWAPVRALDEQAVLLQRLSRNASGFDKGAERQRQQAIDAESKAAVIRERFLL